jgi:bifunctional non-homologous end joining protein LigD
MPHRGPFCFFAFDLLWLDAHLRDRPLAARKRLLRELVPRPSRAILYVDHVASGTDLFRVICDRDMEGVVAKQASASYTPEATTWVKIKNSTWQVGDRAGGLLRSPAGNGEMTD